MITAAHVVIGASQVTVTSSDGIDHTATIVAVDTLTDLAVLEVSGLLAPPVDFSRLEAHDAVTVVGGAASGSVPAEVIRPATLTIDEVRGTRRTSRGGYELRAEIGRGDSGAGVFDADGRLAAIVFAVPTEREGIAWATRADEIEAVLDDVRDDSHYVCEPEASRVIVVNRSG